MISFVFIDIVETLAHNNIVIYYNVYPDFQHVLFQSFLLFFFRKKVKINKLRRPSATCVNHPSRKRLPHRPTTVTELRISNKRGNLLNTIDYNILTTK